MIIKIFQIELSMVFLIYIIVRTMSADLKIIRKRPTGDDGWKEGKDSFISPLLCNETVNCARFNAKVISSSNGNQCKCSCSKENATFMFENNQWKCRKNGNVRDLLGDEQGRPSILFQGESKNDGLRMLKINDPRTINLPDDWSYCQDVHVIRKKTGYLTCNKGFKYSGNFSIQFTLSKLSEGNNKYYLKVTNGVSKTNLLKGRIIKLWIGCRNISAQTLGAWLLFKYNGKLTCSISALTLPPSVTTKPLDTTVTLSPSTSTSSTKHAETDTKTMISEIPPTVSDSAPPTYSVARQTISDALLTTLISQPTTSDTTTDMLSKAPTHSSPNRERSTNENSSSSALIAGLTASILVIVIIFVIVFLVYRRCCSNIKPYSRKESAERKEMEVISTQTGSANELDNGPHDYKELEIRQPAIYTSSYQVPCRDREAHLRENNGNHNEGHVYAPFNISLGENVYGHRNNQETIANDMKPQRNGPISVDQCVYGLMEEIILATLKGPVRGTENGTRPVKNVLEGNYLDVSQRPGQIATMCVEGPVYNTLDGPVNCMDKDTKPVYDVLEAPHLKGAEESSHYGAMGPKEPVYYILEGPVSDNDSDPVYNVLEAPDLEGAEVPSHYGAMSQEGPIYQALEHSNQNSTNEANDLDIANEPIYNVLEEGTY